MSGYDRAITVFSPDGHLFQVEYAMEAVKRGAVAVAAKGTNCVVLGAETKSTAKLQKRRSVKKILRLDDHIAVVFAGLTADARVLINRARVHCQSYRLTNEDAPPVRSVAREIAQIQQKYTVRGGRRPFGLSALIAGYNADGSVSLYRTAPSGTFEEWKANAVGRKDKMMREFLEKHYNDDMNEADTIKLVVKSLLEVVEHGAKNIDIGVLTPGKALRKLSEEEIADAVKQIEAEAEEEGKKGKSGGTGMDVDS